MVVVKWYITSKVQLPIGPVQLLTTRVQPTKLSTNTPLLRNDTSAILLQEFQVTTVYTIVSCPVPQGRFAATLMLPSWLTS